MNARPAFAHSVARVLFLAAACTLPAGAGAQSGYATLHHFEQGPGGAKGRLIQAADGNIYGTASEGGRYSSGLIYVMRPAPGGGWLPPATLHHFRGPEGIKPLAGLTEGAPGILYGTTSEGGARGGGTIFRVAVTGQFQLLHSLNPATDGAKPKAELTKTPDGSFYGSAYEGASFGFGSVFRVTHAGVFTRLRAFSGANGRHPSGAMAVGPDGNLYGTTMFGGAYEGGSMFRMTLAGTLTTLGSFGGITSLPAGPLTFGWDGALYGMTTAQWQSQPFEGSQVYGASYRMTTSGVITNFNGAIGADSGLTLARDGWLYGTTSYPSTFARFYRVWPVPYTVEALPDPPDAGPFGIGSYNSGALLRASDGRLYGATERYGPHGTGTVFSIETGGEQHIVHAFANEGVVPTGSLLRSADGNLYGTTHSGGWGYSGTLFRVAGGNNVSRVADLITHSPGHFVGTPTELSNGHLLAAAAHDLVEILETGETIRWNTGGAHSGLVEAPDGLVYGARSDDGTGFGGIRRFGPDTFELVHAFDGSDGRGPLGGLMRASDGHIYGTTASGGAFGHGTVFRFQPDGIFATLHHFNGADGSFATARLIEGPDGLLYGTTLLGGDAALVPQGGGTIFKIGKDGSGFTSLHLFTGANGLLPFTELTLGSDGLFYGTTYAGGLGSGTVFVLNGDGAFAIVHRFGSGEGAYPLGGVTEWSGALYGTTSAGGAANLGVLYRIGAG